MYRAYLVQIHSFSQSVSQSFFGAVEQLYTPIPVLDSGDNKVAMPSSPLVHTVRKLDAKQKVKVNPVSEFADGNAQMLGAKSGLRTAPFQGSETSR